MLQFMKYNPSPHHMFVFQELAIVGQRSPRGNHRKYHNGFPKRMCNAHCAMYMLRLFKKLGNRQPLAASSILHIRPEQGCVPHFSISVTTDSSGTAF